MKQLTRKTLGVLLALVMVLALLPGVTVTAQATEPPAAPLFGTYTLTIPSALNIANPGWNATDGISASGELPQGKTLSVTASSDGEFALVNNLNSEKKIPYALAAATDATPTDVWTFDSVTAEAQTLPMGVIVEDYTDMPAGTYEDTVTFTVKVVDAA